MLPTRMLLFLSLAFLPLVNCVVPALKARAIIYRAVKRGIPIKAIGIMNFTEHYGVVTITGKVDGLHPGAHGFHVHEFGDLRNECLAAGLHFDPYGTPHGGPKNSPRRRHVGDLGNIVTFANGTTMINMKDSLITLMGPRGIIGRSIVIHEHLDDFVTGPPGARYACGIIGFSME